MLAGTLHLACPVSPGVALGLWLGGLVALASRLEGLRLAAPGSR